MFVVFVYPQEENVSESERWSTGDGFSNEHSGSNETQIMSPKPVKRARGTKSKTEPTAKIDHSVTDRFIKPKLHERLTDIGCGELGDI